MITRFFITVLTFIVSFIRGYRLSPGSLQIIYPFWRRTISLDGLAGAEADPAAMGWTYVMINGGFFSFGGKGCRNKRLGVYDAFATDTARSVVLRYGAKSGDRIVVVTPGDPDAFVAEVKRCGTLEGG